jgi:predicted aspartyl protease
MAGSPYDPDMLSGCLTLLLTSLFAANPETVLKTARLQHLLVLNEVYLNGIGPFRMMIDTGNASSSLSPAAAQRLGLRPAYQVEQVTATGSTFIPAAIVQEVKAGGVVDAGVEVMISTSRMREVDGVLGQSWLSRHDYLLDYREKRLVLDGTPPLGGIRRALRQVDGRPAIEALVDGRHRELVLDSGAPAVVLFERAAVRNTAMMFTNNGSAPVESGWARIDERRMKAVRVNASEPQTGLLGLSAFRAVYISNSEGFAMLAP